MDSVEFGAIKSAETALAAYLACGEVVLTSSGLTALEIALIASGAHAGTVVACDALYPFAGMAAVNIGARPIPVDLNPETQVPLWESVLECRAAGATILIITSYFGRRTATAAFVFAAKAIGLTVVEDRAQCFGPHPEPWLSVLSFQTGKFLSCGFGGAIVVPDSVPTDLFRRQINLGWWPREHTQGTDWASGWADRVNGRSARLPPLAAEALEQELHSVRATERTLAIATNELRGAVEAAAESDGVVPDTKGTRLVLVQVRSTEARTAVGEMLEERGVVWGHPVHPPVTEWPGLGPYWLKPRSRLPGTRKLLNDAILVSLDTWSRKS